MDITVFDKQDTKVRLDKISEKPPKKLTEEAAQKELAKLGEELFDLQDLLWGARRNSVLVILQGRDSAGKDGAIKHVAGFLNPRGVHVTSFGVPDSRGARARLPLAHPPPRASQGRVRHLQPLALRGRARRPRARSGAQVPVEGALRSHPRLRGAARRARDDRPQVLPPHQQGRAEEAPARAREGSAHGVEAQPGRLGGARAVGRLHGRLRGGHLPHRDEAGAVAHRPRGLPSGTATSWWRARSPRRSGRTAHLAEAPRRGG